MVRALESAIDIQLHANMRYTIVTKGNDCNVTLNEKKKETVGRRKEGDRARARVVQRIHEEIGDIERLRERESDVLRACL